jgi:hypothetical protein
MKREYKIEIIREILKGNLFVYDNYKLKELFDIILKYNRYIELQDYDNNKPWMIDTNLSAHQIIDDDDYGGFIEEYASFMITIRIENGQYLITTDGDSSHFYDDFDERLAKYFVSKIPELILSRYSGPGIKYKTPYLNNAVSMYKKLYSVANNLSISKTKIEKKLKKNRKTIY